MAHSLSGIETLCEDASRASELQLPTMAAGIGLLNGDASKLIPATLLYAARAAQIAGGIGLTGGWSDRAWKNALAGSAAVQIFLLLYAYLSGSHDKARLPSSQSAEALVQGQRGALNTVILHWLGRSAIIGLGMIAAGERKNVMRQAMAGGGAIELAVILYALKKKAESDGTLS